MSQKEFVKPVGLETPYRLFNLGGTAFVESKQGDDLDIMPASWNCPLDYDKMTRLTIPASSLKRANTSCLPFREWEFRKKFFI